MITGDDQTVGILEKLVERFEAPLSGPLSPDDTIRANQLSQALGRRFGYLPELPGDPPMAVVTFSIGTSGRDYSTWASHEADLDNSGLYNSGDDAVGEFYNDSTFDESVTINGGGTVGVNSITYRAATGEGHDGTAGTGARMVATNNRTITGQASNVTLEDFEINGGGYRTYLTVTGEDWYVERNLWHNCSTGLFAPISAIILSTSLRSAIQRNIMYGITRSANNYDVLAITITNFGSFANRNYVNSNTVYKTENPSATSREARGIHLAGSNDADVQNNIVMDTYAAISGDDDDYQCPFTTASVSHNLSSDATAPGTSSLTNKASSNQFVSTVGGSEDLHLKTGADAIDAGTDLGTTPTGINVDIDGRDVDAEGDTWDMGADELVAAAAPSGFPFQLYYAGSDAI